MHAPTSSVPKHGSESNAKTNWNIDMLNDHYLKLPYHTS